MRKLAERTQIATKEITATISNIQAETQQTLRSMNQSARDIALAAEAATVTKQSLERIKLRTANALDIVARIAAASHDQAHTSHIITETMDDIRQVKQRSATTTNTIAGQAETLNTMNEHLQTLVQQFKLHTDDETSTLPRRQHLPRPNVAHLLTGAALARPIRTSV